MTEPTSNKRGNPWLDIQGPRADIPPSGGPGELPYAGDKPPAEPTSHRRRNVALAGIALVVLVAATAWAVTAPADETTVQGASPSPSTTLAPERATTTDAPATTTEAPATTTTEARTTTTTEAPSTEVGSATEDIAVDDLPRHEAVYRDGKLILQGTVPSKAVQEQFRAEAAAVIGADNVIVRYQIDPRASVPTDGRVRVDEDFLFPKNSAEIDPRYEPLMQLGVTVMRLNPQASMRIVGYTDDSGTPEVNLRISTARAQALRAYLAANGIDQGRVDAVGRGEVDFVAPNDTEENRGRNRRIEIELIDLLED